MQITALKRQDKTRMKDLGYQNPEREAALMACSPDCIKLMTPEGRISYMSDNGLCAMEIAELTDILGKSWADLWQASNRHLIDGALSAARSGKTASFVADCATALGNPARWEVTVQGVFDDDGQLQEIISVSRLTQDPVRAVSIT